MVLKVITSWPAALPNQATRNNASADAELPQIVAGRARWLYEMATGGPATPGATPGVPRNPQGKYGHDHSGPPFGTAFKHPLFYFSGEENTASDWTSSRNTYDLTSSFPFPQPILTFTPRVWVKPFARYNGAPYSRGWLYVRLRAVAPSSITIDVTVGSATTPTRARTLTLDTTMRTLLVDDSVPLEPGWNDLTITLGLRKNSSGEGVRIVGMALMQAAKRAH